MDQRSESLEFPLDRDSAPSDTQVSTLEDPTANLPAANTELRAELHNYYPDLFNSSHFANATHPPKIRTRGTLLGLVQQEWNPS
jgi:hypothetical protein